MPSNFPPPAAASGGGISDIVEDTTPQLGGNLDGGGYAITNIGNVDGRDVSADGTKLDGIESNATADQTGAQIKTAYEAEADTNAFTDADHTKLDGIATAATANPRSATTIFEATLSSATQNCNGTVGSTHDFTWTPTTNNATYIDTFSGGDSVVTFVSAGEYVLDTQVVVTDSAANNRTIFTLHLIHENSTPTELHDGVMGCAYVRDDAAAYDSGGVGGQGITVFAAAGDRLIVRRTTLDTGGSAGLCYASQSDSKLRIQVID